MPISIPKDVMKTITEEKPTLSLENFADDLCKIAERVLDLVEYEDNTFAIIEDADVVASDANHIFTVISYHCDMNVEQPNVLEIRTTDGELHYINTQM